MIAELASLAFVKPASRRRGVAALSKAGGIPEYAARCFSYPGFYSAWRKVAADTNSLDLRYEEMASDPEASIQTISRFLQLESIDTKLVMRRVERDTRLDGKFYLAQTALQLSPDVARAVDTSVRGRLCDAAS
jgi:hypothetical protein